MKVLHRLALRWIVALAVCLVAGCAIKPRTSIALDPTSPHWQGRLWVKIRSVPAQAFSADFELQGTPQIGELSFTSPLGNTLARLQWGPSGAQLQTGRTTEHFESLDALTLRSTGTALPIVSLFSWLQGNNLATPGWEADLQSLPQGRLHAKRLGSDAPAEFQIVLDQ